MIPSPTTTNFRFKSGRLKFDDDGALSIECSLENEQGNDVVWIANGQFFFERRKSRGRFYSMSSPSSSTRRTTTSVFWPSNCTKGRICYGWMSPAVCIAGVLQVSNHGFSVSCINPFYFNAR